jgi:hypothetical protein
LLIQGLLWPGIGFLLNRTQDPKKVMECAPVVAIALLTICPHHQGAAIFLCLAQFTSLLGAKNPNQLPLHLVRRIRLVVVGNWVSQVVATFVLGLLAVAYQTGDRQDRERLYHRVAILMNEVTWGLGMPGCKHCPVCLVV